MDELLRAIAVVADPRSPRELQAQAIDHLNAIRANPAQSWRLAVQLFISTNPDGSRTYDPQIRAFSLQIIDDLLQSPSDQLDPAVLSELRNVFLEYIQSEYVHGQADAQAVFIRNKFCQSLTLLFLATYPSQWPDFFPSMFQMLRTNPNTSLTSFNPNITNVFLRTLMEISGEVADTILKAARDFTQERHRRDSLAREHIRDRDSGPITEAILAIISEHEVRLAALRESTDRSDTGVLEDLLALSIRAFAGLIPWINVNLTVTPDTITILFRLISDAHPQIRIETATCFLKMVQKGLPVPADKLSLLRVLSLREVIETIEARTRGDEDNVTFREMLGRVTGALGVELSKLNEDGSLDSQLTAQSGQMLSELLPVMLRFLADEWDEVSHTVHLTLAGLLNSYKRLKKSHPHTHMTPERKSFLTALLEILLQKSKWEPSTDFDDLDEDDKAAFEQMRRDLRSFLDSVHTLDEELVISYIKNITFTYLNASRNGETVPWQDIELAVYLVFVFGELSKGIKGPGSFVIVPQELRAEQKATALTARRPKLPYRELPLNPHGELIMTLVQSEAYQYPHPFVTSQYFETFGRYGEFFRARPECIHSVLKAFIGPSGIHTKQEGQRGRFYYLFHRFIRDVRHDIPQGSIMSILQGLGDLLSLDTIEFPEDDSPGEDILESAVNATSLFDSQIYLFETTGTLLSLLEDEKQKEGLLRMLTGPILGLLETALQTQMINSQDVLPVLKVHHYVRALGNISKGFPDVHQSTPVDPSNLPPWILVFDEIGAAINTSLSTMAQFKIVRDSARFAFSRLIATCGARQAQFIPALVGSMLNHCTAEEVADFINFLSLVVHRLQAEILAVVDELTAPLFQHMVALLTQEVEGTDGRRAHLASRKAYLEFLISIVSGSLRLAFNSERNRGMIEPICQLAISIAKDTSDPPSQKAAFSLLSKLVSAFTSPAGQSQQENRNGHDVVAIPGFEQFIYQTLVPLAFELPSLPGFNAKDGQTLGVIGESGVFLTSVRNARGQEANEFFSQVYLPSKGWPNETISQFLEALEDKDTKKFRKFWTDFVRQAADAASTVTGAQ